MNRPKTIVVLAMSADGKIGDADRNGVNFGSKADFAHLETQVALADAVLFGAGTLRAGGSAMRVQSPKLIARRIEQGKPAQPIQIVCSRSGKIDRGLKFFEQPIPRWLLTTPVGATNWLQASQFDQVLAYQESENELDWGHFFEHCHQAKMETLVVLGGGEVVAALLEANYLDELWLTVCPVLIGGRGAPSPVDGNGMNQDLAPRLSLESCQQVGHELFLHYKILRTG
jgi:5-amino-6-(5-phosphoribosylamino)uracil reductase